MEHNGKTHRPGQRNNVYIFPGIGSRAVVSEASLITDEMLLVVAKAPADQVSETDLQEGAIYPPLTDIRNISLKIAVTVTEKSL